MPRLSYGIDKVDVGIVTNLPSRSVVWSAGRNVSFRPGIVMKIPGKELLTTITNTPIRAKFTFKAYDNVWRTIVCSDNTIYSYTNNFTIRQDITPTTPPSSTSTDTWCFGLIGGIPIISNGVNPTWKWDNFSSIVTPLSGTPLICQALHVINNRLILGDIQEGGYSFPARIRWSDVITVTNWAKNLSLVSGQKDLVSPHTSMDGIDRVKAITNFGNRMVLFSERNIWFGGVGGFPEIFLFESLDQNIGLAAKKAYVKTPAGIFFMGQEDFYRITQGMPEPIGFRIRNSCFPNINKPKIETAFAYYKYSTREVVFCVPTGTNETPDTAFVYGVETDSWAIWDVDYICHSLYFDSSNMQYDTLPYGSYDSITDSRYDDMGITGQLPTEAVGNVSGQILKQAAGYNNNGEPINAYIESGDFIGKDFNGNDLVDINKIIYELWPSLKPQESINALMVQVGVRDNLHQDIIWSNPVPYTIGVSRNVNVRTQGKWIRVRYYTDTMNSPWIIDGWKLKFDKGSSR